MVHPLILKDEKRNNKVKLSEHFPQEQVRKVMENETEGKRETERAGVVLHD